MFADLEVAIRLGALGSHDWHCMERPGLVWVVLAMTAVCWPGGALTAYVVGASDGSGDSLRVNVGLRQGVGSGFLAVYESSGQCFLGDKRGWLPWALLSAAMFWFGLLRVGLKRHVTSMT